MKKFLTLSSPTLLLAMLPAIFSPWFHETAGADWLFLPGKARGPILAASPQEPRTGLQKEIGTSRMKLDIGASLELLEFAPSPSDCFRLGVSLFTYALTTSNNGLRLQIDAVDGYFGGYIAYVHTATLSESGVRFRFLHRSAHYVDGHIDPATAEWEDGRAPVPYSKDFGELLAYFQPSFMDGVLQVYAGSSYAVLVRPETIERFEGMAGMSWRTGDGSLEAFGNPLSLYAAYHFSLEGIPDYVGSNSVESGVKFGQWTGTGVRAFLGFHSGLEVFGQYYDVRRETWLLGFALDIR